ncbi:hypothetical protein LLG95_11165 [bacterium]|nr:hypothetical protein [bacterium]
MDERNRAKSKFPWRLVGLILLVLILLIGRGFLGHGVTSEQTERMQRNQQVVAELQKKLAAERITSHPEENKGVATKDSITTMSADRAALQERCDTLFKDIFDTWNSKPHPAPFDVWAMQQTQNLSLSLLPQARELAALYDRGIRVSAKAKIGYRTNENALLISRLSYYLMESNGYKWGTKQSSEEILKYLIPAAKFERVVELPLASSGVTSALQQLLDPEPVTRKDMGFPPFTYPQAIQNLDLELISPRRAWDWREQLPGILEYSNAWANDFTKKMSTIRGTYDWICEIHGNGSVPEKIWRTALYLPGRQGQVETHLKFAEELNAQAGNVHSYADFTRNISDSSLTEMMIGSQTQEQIKSRLMCAGLEILHGNPIPTQVTPDSYFYDPYRGGRVKIEQTPISKNNVRIKLSCSYAANPQEWNFVQSSIILPANHPALKEIKNQR